MRISDWSSDVCSSDLSYLVMPRCCGWSRIRQGQIQLVVATLVNTSLPVTEGSTALPQSSVFPRLGVEHRRDSHEFVDAMRRSEESRVGKECVSTCRSRWSP